MMFNRDYSDLLKLLSESGVDYMIVGAYAMAAHGVVRATGDIDIFVRPSMDNSAGLYQALSEFGAPLDGITPEEFSEPGLVYQIGVPPTRIYIINDIDGVSFEDASPVYREIDGMKVPFIDLESLKKNKSSTGRVKDRLDLELLDGAE